MTFGAITFDEMFQHTATRRWLRIESNKAKISEVVSTHSHPKVAAKAESALSGLETVSTHSHPKVAAST